MSRLLRALGVLSVVTASASSFAQAPRIDRIEPRPGTSYAVEGGLRAVRIGFSKRVVVPEGAISAWSVAEGTPIGVTTSYDTATSILTVTFASPIQQDRLTLVADYSIRDVDNLELDGEVADPANASLPTGDGVRGGQAVFRFNALAGDLVSDGQVDLQDISYLVSNFGQHVRSAGDLDGDADTDLQDLSTLLSNFGTPFGATRELGDLDGDEDVDIQDLATVLAAFGTTVPAPGDLDGDGDTGLPDLAILLAHYGERLPATDGNAPRVVARFPEIDGRARGFPLDTVEVRFSEPLKSELLGPHSLFAVRPDGLLQSASTALFDDERRRAWFTFLPPLMATFTYDFRLCNALADESGELFATDTIRGWTALIDASPTTIAESSPASREGMVALDRETIITVRDTIDITTVTPENVFASFAGQTIPALLRPTPDGKRLRLFYDPPLPPSARVRVTVDGSGIVDDLGHALDADGDGQPGGVLHLDFDTCSATRIPNTVIWGYVIASERGPSGEDRPIEGVTIRADGMPDLFAVTNAAGFFALGAALTGPNDCGNPSIPAPGCPAPEFFVHIDGGTATSVGGQPIPPGGGYPNVGKPFHTVPGQCIQLSMDGTAFNIHLPFVPDEILNPVTPGQPTEAVLGDAGRARLCELYHEFCPNGQPPPSFDLMQLDVPADSLSYNDGAPGMAVGIFPVDSNRLPAPLPPGLEHTFDITVQTDGATNFDRPAPITFPNIENLPAGSKTLLMSFDHDIGQWVVVGPMTVSDDGVAVTTDPGVGVLAPGWHGMQVGANASGGGSASGGCDECETQRRLLLSGARQCIAQVALAPFEAPPGIGCAISVGGSVAGAVIDCLIDPTPSACSANMQSSVLSAGIWCIPGVGGQQALLTSVLLRMFSELST